ncbi:negative elongation factor E-like [Lineus longissimus]|uniref:negative elongation factor E-like n=1 Tax=Lineus longissimus TaxID=88925 RepID=UPI002B4F7495
MKYVHYPQHLTEEEEILTKKYAKLRKKRKALQALRMPKADPVHQQQQAPVNLKRSATESEEIKEDIKKLVKAGAIKLESDREKKAFKRRTKDPDKNPTAVGFQPFDEQDKVEPPVGKTKSMKGLYESFIPEVTPEKEEPRDQERDARERARSERHSTHDQTRKGNTIYVTGKRINEDMLKETFKKYGTIVNVNLETGKERGFVTFDTTEAADKAIMEVDKTLVSGIYLIVSLARRQPQFEGTVDPSRASWASIAASHSQKGSHKDKRDLVTYDEDIF